eukprot:946491-Amphidinium_carterae.1
MMQEMPPSTRPAGQLSPSLRDVRIDAHMLRIVVPSLMDMYQVVWVEISVQAGSDATRDCAVRELTGQPFKTASDP